MPPLRYDATIKPLGHEEFDTRVVSALNQFAMNVEDKRLADMSRSLVGFVQKPLQAEVNMEGINNVRDTAQ